MSAGAIQEIGFTNAGFEDWNKAKEGGAKWHLLYVKSRHEKMVATEVAAKQLNHFLPLCSQERLSRAKQKSVQLPLFPGYLFLLSELDDAYEIDRGGHVVEIIRVADQRTLHSELENLRRTLLSCVVLTEYPYLHEGLRVRVRSGPLQGVQGVVEDRYGANRLILQVQMLARAACLEIDAHLLDPIT